MLVRYIVSLTTQKILHLLFIPAGMPITYVRYALIYSRWSSGRRGRGRSWDQRPPRHLSQARGRRESYKRLPRRIVIIINLKWKFSSSISWPDRRPLSCAAPRCSASWPRARASRQLVTSRTSLLLASSSGVQRSPKGDDYRSLFLAVRWIRLFWASWIWILCNFLRFWFLDLTSSVP
jgi:hypothetical protein